MYVTIIVIALIHTKSFMLDVANNPCKMKCVIIVGNNNNIWITLFQLMTDINHFSLSIHVDDLYHR